MPNQITPVTASLSFAKLVATPTEFAWSQAYNAGNIFVCLTLLQKEIDDTILLQALGKESINIFESEFFTLDSKDPASIKKALSASLEHIPPEVTHQLTVSHFKDDILTVFISGCGKVVMKRGEKIGTLLEKDTADNTITFASGYLHNADTIIMQSGDFAKKITEQTITSALELSLPNDIVETLSPQMHEHAQGGESAIVITYHSSQATTHHEQPTPEANTLASLYKPEPEPHTSSHTQHHLTQNQMPDDDYDPPHHSKNRIHFPSVHLPKMHARELHLTHRKKLYLTVAVILAALLVLSIVMALSKQNDTKQQALFTTIYTQATQYYEEGQGLSSLNQSLSQESYKRAEAKIHEADGKIAPDSKEGKQLQALLAKIRASQTGDTGQTPTSSTAKEITPDDHSLLAIEKANTSALAFGQDEKTVYMMTDKAITMISKSAGTKKELIKNDDYWESPKAIVSYQGNIYVLDQTKGILKFVGGTTKSNYFTSDAPDLSSATGMAIDGSVWVVTTDGNLMKFTRGKKDSFGLSGFDKSLKNPSKIYTTIDLDYVYILDAGNNRIVKIDKKGAFQKAIVSPTIGKAKDFAVVESDQKAYILSNDKVYELAL